MRQNFSVVIYEPFGSGGICHYTHQLAEGLTISGLDITILTQGNYELRHFPKAFKVNDQLESSQLKNLLVRAANRLKSTLRTESAVEDASTCLSQQKGHTALHSTSRLARFRRWMLWCEAIYFLLKQRPRVIHFQWLLRPNEDYFFVRCLRWLGFPIVYTAHNLMPHDSSARNEKRALQRIYGVMDAVIVHAEANKRELLREFAVTPSRVAVIPHGSYSLFCPEPALEKDAAKEALNISPSKKVILFFGAIRRYKGLEYLVDAFLKVKAKRKDVLLLIVGKIDGKDSEEAQFYHALIARIRQRDDVMVVHEYVEMEKVALYFAASDLVALPYTKTYQSGVLLLAYAIGRPVVVTDTGGLAEVVEVGRNGFVVPPLDVDALAGAIEEIVAAPQRIEEMGAYSKHLAATKFSWNAIASATSDLYRSVERLNG